jgi:heptaprenyl diphosphate synthase
MSAQNTAEAVTATRDDLLALLNTELDRVESVILSLAHPGTNPLGEALSHLARAGGKRLRPLLALASAHAAARISPDLLDRAVRAAAAVEILHVGTLYHDDVMDEAQARRGGPSVNQKWGNCAAVLGGDVLISRAIVTAARLGPHETAILSGTLEDLCDGQALETKLLFDVSRSRDDYFQAIERKTASLFAASCQLGALAAGRLFSESSPFALFGHGIGVAFQIVDDVLDLVDTGEFLGKPPGTDLREGVYTLPVIIALERDEELRRLLPALSADEEVERARARILDTGAARDCLKTAKLHIERSQRHLRSPENVDTRYVEALIGIAESLISRGKPGAADPEAAPTPVQDILRQWQPQPSARPARGWPAAAHGSDREEQTEC